MKAYKRDFDGEKFILLEFDISHVYDFSNEPKTNLDNNPGHNINKKAIEDAINEDNLNMIPEFNRDSLFNNFTVKKCKDCGKYFRTSWTEWVFMKSMEFQLPVRCDTCRSLRKKKKS